MKVYRDRFGSIIRLTNKRRNHIIRRHPMVEPYLYRAGEVLSNPELVKRSRGDKDTFLYYKYYDDIYEGKYLLVVAKIRNGSIVLTCYITDRIKEGELVWKKN